MIDHLQTEARNPASANLDELATPDLVRLMNAEDAKVAPAVLSQAAAIARAVDVIAERLAAGGRLVYAGAGTSGRLGVLDATECPPTFNVPPGLVLGVIAGGPTALTRAVEGAEDHPEFGAQDLDAVGFTAADVLVGIATSGRTPYVLGAADHARAKGAFTIGIACNADADLIAHVDLPIIPVVGPEVLSGSTRLKAGTATKLVLNMLTTGAMVRLGKTFGNLMVDLRATNEKLRHRTNRIVREVTGLDRAAADALLDRCGRELKTALVAHLAGVTAEQARERLAAAGGRVRSAVAPTSPPREQGTSPPREQGLPTSPPREQGLPGSFPENPTPNPLPHGERGLQTPPSPAGKEAAGLGSSHHLLLGVDGGGTGTVALLAVPDGTGWRVVGRGEAGPGNPKAVGTAVALAAVDAAVAGAFAAAGEPRRPVRAACLGLAGAGRWEDQVPIREWAARAGLALSVNVVADAALLPAAGTPEGWGVAVVAGTGSMAFARAPDGRTARAGGWGYLMGDEGSGYALASAGLRAVARAADGRGPATDLTARLLAVQGLSRPEELIGAVYGNPDRAAVAALAPVVLEAADGGDAVATGIVGDGAAELAAAAASAARTLGLGPVAPVAVAGGLLVASAGYRDRFLTALRDRGLTPDPVAVVAEPAEGAVRLALALTAS